MRTPLTLPKSLLSGAAFLAGSMLYPHNAVAQSPAPAPPQQANSEETRLVESEKRLGAFAMGGQTFAVAAIERSISPTSNASLATTLAELQIRDANETVVYHESFPYEIQDGHFAQKLSAVVSSLMGAGGAALVIRFVERPATAGEGESFQVFGLVQGKLAQYKAPLPLGQGGGPAGSVLTGVMLRGGIGVMPLSSTAEALEFRAWTGNVFAYVPMRMDWAQGQWSEGEQCFENIGGSLRLKGCNLRIAVNAGSRSDGSTVTLYAEPVEEPFNTRQVPVGRDKQVEFLLVRAAVNWQSSGERITCRFDDVWLRVRISGNEGWVHSEADLATLGLPASSPPQ